MNDADEIHRLHEENQALRNDLSHWQSSSTDLDGSEIHSLQEALQTSQYALQQSEDRWHFALEGSGDGVWDWNIEDNVTFFSHRWKEMLGYEDAEVAPTFEGWSSRVHPDDWERVIETQMRQVRGEAPAYSTEYRMRCKDGSYKWVLARGKVVAFDAVGNPLRMVGTHTDISERRANEAERLRLTAELKERAEHLEAVNVELEAFSYAASHDLRAPIRSMEGFSAALLEDYGETLDARAANYLRRIHAAALRMRNLLESLRLLSQITHSGLNRESVDLSQLAAHIVQELDEQFPLRTLTVQIQPDLTASADPTLMRVVLTNLLANAYKFTSKHVSAQIAFGAQIQNSQTVYFVRDDGAGFDPVFLSGLFRPFQRLHSRTECEGNGIGLATVQRIIHRHGGQIWAEGAPEQGAVFFFTLEGERDNAP